eukprot:g768.t1
MITESKTVRPSTSSGTEWQHHRVGKQRESYREYKDREAAESVAAAAAAGTHKNVSDSSLRFELSRSQSKKNLLERQPVASAGRHMYSSRGDGERSSRSTPRSSRRDEYEESRGGGNREDSDDNVADFWEEDDIPVVVRRSARASGSRPASRVSRASSQASAFELDHQIVQLNVGGTMFATSRETLLRDKDSMLAVMVRRTRPSTTGSRQTGIMGTTRDDTDAIFLDRDPTYFRYVLNFLRDGEVDLPNEKQALNQILREASFFQIQGLTNLCHMKERNIKKSKNVMSRSELLHLLNYKNSVHNASSGSSSSRRNIEKSRDKLNNHPIQIPGAILKGLDLSWLRIHDVLMIKVDLGEANLRNCEIVNCHLSNANFKNADLSYASLTNCKLDGANFNSALMRKTQLNKCDLTNACLDGADLTRANLQDSLLKRVTFTTTNLSGSILYGADLSGFDLSGCNLQGANLEGCDLRNTDLRDTNMKNCNLFNADLNGALMEGSCLTDANLRRANLLGVIGKYFQ